MNAITFSPDGKYLATASGRYGTAQREHIASAWEVDNGRQDFRMVHDGPVYDVAYSQDGKYLATASKDGTARVWDTKSGREVAKIEHEALVNSVAFSPDGKFLATGSSDPTVRVWPWQSESLVNEACSRLTRNLTKSEWEVYLPDEPNRKTC